MSCGGCVVAVRNVLLRMPGLSHVEVEVGRVTLDLDETQSSEQRVTEAISRAGFEVVAHSRA